MQLYDETTMPLEQTLHWDPSTILGRAITQQPWSGVPFEEKQMWLENLNSVTNDRTTISKLVDFEAFLTVIFRGHEVMAKFIVLTNFEDFIQGPMYHGPYN